MTEPDYTALEADIVEWVHDFDNVPADLDWQAKQGYHRARINLLSIIGFHKARTGRFNPTIVSAEGLSALKAVSESDPVETVRAIGRKYR